MHFPLHVPGAHQINLENLGLYINTCSTVADTLVYSHDLSAGRCNLKSHFKIVGKKVLPLQCLCNDICKCLDFLVFTNQGHPTTIFGKYLFGRRFEI